MKELISQRLDEVCEQLPQLKALSAKLKGIKDEDLRELFRASADPQMQKRASLINTRHCSGVEYVAALLSTASLELERLADLSEVETSFPEVVDPSTLPPEVPSVAPEVAPSPVEDETQVHIQIEGPQGVEMVQQDGQIYVILPGDSVLQVSEASASTREAILAKRQTPTT